MTLCQRNEDKVLKETRRNIIRGLLETFILARIKKSSILSGYDLVQIIHRQFDFWLSPASVYSALYSLERKGLIELVPLRSIQSRKRVYRLTEEGHRFLDVHLKFHDNIVSFIMEILTG